jgi:Uri superfamily endonuclease
MNGLEQRIRRHLSEEKKIHWHIDNLTVIADAMEAYVSLEPIKECALAKMAAESGCVPAAKGFGCSDCRCGTHLFITDERSKKELLKATSVVPFGK